MVGTQGMESIRNIAKEWSGRITHQALQQLDALKNSALEFHYALPSNSSNHTVEDILLISMVLDTLRSKLPCWVSIAYEVDGDRPVTSTSYYPLSGASDTHGKVFYLDVDALAVELGKRMTSVPIMMRQVHFVLYCGEGP